MLALDAGYVCWTNYNLGVGASVWRASVWRASKDCCENQDAGTDASVDAAGADGSLDDASVDGARGSG